MGDYFWKLCVLRVLRVQGLEHIGRIGHMFQDWTTIYREAPHDHREASHDHRKASYDAAEALLTGAAVYYNSRESRFSADTSSTSDT